MTLPCRAEIALPVNLLRVALGAFINFRQILRNRVIGVAMGPVTHFEMPAEDRARMRKFYESTFGWKTHQLGKEMGDYVLVTTADTDEKRMVTKPGAINGGFYQKTDDPLSNHPSIVIQVENIEASMKKVKAAGGKVIGKPMPIPGVGTFVSIIDTEGNRVSIIQPGRK